jgi:hypothetical protein
VVENQWILKISGQADGWTNGWVDIKAMLKIASKNHYQANFECQ